MGRKQGQKNRRLSRYDLATVSVETLKETILTFIHKIKTEDLTLDEQKKLIDLYHKMRGVLEAGEHHLQKDKKW